MLGFDRLTLLASVLALAVWVLWPEQRFTGFILLAFAAIHAVRLLRWGGLHTLAEPLVWVLHLGYAFVPLGALAVGLGILLPQAIGLTALQHLWMAGAIGLMTLAVMTRATLGHTGRDLHAGPATLGIYLALIGSVAVRLAAGLFLEWAFHLYACAAILWIIAFGGFAIAYAPMLLRPKPGNPQ